MKHKSSAATRVVAVLVCMFGLAESEAAEAESPNILLVTADDLGLQLGCYGDKVAHTPNLDRFAEEGVRFTRAFVTQASCSPSRSSMLTGLYPHQNGQVGLSHRGYSMHDATIPTLPGELKKAGYTTGKLPRRIRSSISTIWRS